MYTLMRVSETMSMNIKKYKALLKNLPKTEIHLHLEGIASVETIWQLMQKNSLSIPGIDNKEDLKKRFMITSLDEFISLFINVIQNCFQNSSDISYLIKDAKDYLIRNNVRYAEIFFAPSKFVLNGLPFSELVEQLQKGAEEIKKTEGIDIKYIIDVSRSYGTENAEKNLSLTLANRSDSIIGIGLGGAEATGPAKEFKKVFEKARASGLQVVAHAGEDVGPESIWDAINYLHASRIGHGISAIQDKKLMDFLRDKQIPLEICPTSNLFTQKYVKTLKEHPIRQFFDHQIKVTVNTDDPSLFGVELLDEYMNLLTEDFFKQGELIALIKNNIYSTFLQTSEQDRLWNDVLTILEKENIVSRETL